MISNKRICLWMLLLSLLLTMGFCAYASADGEAPVEATLAAIEEENGSAGEDGSPETHAATRRVIAKESADTASERVMEAAAKGSAEKAEKKAEEAQAAQAGYKELGTFRLTAYCGCRRCNGRWTGLPTASGTDYREGRTIAVDKNVIPLGSTVEIYIPGRGWQRFRAEDTGSAIKGNRIDIYVSEHSRCYTPAYNCRTSVRLVR